MRYWTVRGVDGLVSQRLGSRLAPLPEVVRIVAVSCFTFLMQLIHTEIFDRRCVMQHLVNVTAPHRELFEHHTLPSHLSFFSLRTRKKKRRGIAV